MPVDLKAIEGAYLCDLLDQPRAIGDTLENLATSKALQDLASRLRQGEFQRIVLTGMGSSFHALHPLYLQLISHGFTAVMVETSELIHYQAPLLAAATLVIAVSQSGQSAEIVRLVEVSQKSVPVIAITNTPESPLAKRATAALVTQAGREFSVSCKTYVAGLMALKWLGDILCQFDLDQTRRELGNAAPAFAAYLEHWQKHVTTLADRLTAVRHLFLVGRGASLAAVGTGALIIKESDRFHAEGMSSAAFRHGPFEMLRADIFVVVFSGNDKTRALNHRLLADIQEARSRAEFIGEDSPLECFRLADHGSSLRPMLEILPVQMITLALASLGGREPGKFDRATKITTSE